MKCLSEALLSTTKLSQDDILLLPAVLDSIPNLEYEITKKGNRNVITFSSEHIGFRAWEGKDKNLTIDGDVYNCDVNIQNNSYRNIFCYINFVNTNITCLKSFCVVFSNKMENVKIHSSVILTIKGSCFIKNCVIETPTNPIELCGNVNKKTNINNVTIDSSAIRLNTWHPDCVSKTSCLCNTLIVINSEDTVFKPIDRFMRDIRNEQNDSEKNIVNKSKLQSWMHLCTGFQFKKLPSEIRIIGNHLIYKYIQQKNGSYQYSIIQ